MKKRDSKIIKLLQKQDKKAISILYDRYAPALYGIVLKIVRSEEIAQDVLQEAFVKIWKNGAQYNAKKGTLFTWMLNITRNTAIDKTRSASFRNSGKIQGLDLSVSDNKNLSFQNNPDHIGLKDMVNGLEEKYRVILDLIYFQGYTHSEVVETLDIPLGTVKSRIRIGLRELRKLFVELNPALLLLIWLFISVG